METSDLLALVENLEENIDDLEESIDHLLSTALAATTKKLPVLDKAKLYILIVYSIESLLFSYLRLNGVQAKEHKVYKELTRVKQYFQKITVAEAGPVQPRENLSLDKQAAGRFIRQALAGNSKIDTERAEREARERLLAKRRLQSLEANKLKKQEAQPLAVVEQPAENSDSDSTGSSDEDEEGEITSTSQLAPTSSAEDKAPSDVTEGPSSKDKKRKREDGKRKARKQAKREARESIAAQVG